MTNSKKTLYLVSLHEIDDVISMLQNAIKHEIYGLNVYNTPKDAEAGKEVLGEDLPDLKTYKLTLEESKE